MIPEKVIGKGNVHILIFEPQYLLQQSTPKYKACSKIIETITMLSK